MSRSRQLPEPVIIIARFWKGRGGEALVVELKEYSSIVIVDVRIHITNAAGQLVPTGRGISCDVKHVPGTRKGDVKGGQQSNRIKSARL